jgi:hypothetical protein
LTGAPLPRVAAAASSPSADPARLRDGRGATHWRTTAPAPPAAAWAYVDLGGSKRLTGVRWVFARTGAADHLRIQTSPDRRVWTTVATVGNAPQGAWQQRALSGTARYVRFYFTNRNGDPQLGYLAEVQVWGQAATAASIQAAAIQPTVAPTRTPVPTATNTPVATPTNTPRPTSTNTPIPLPTTAPVPTSTATPAPTASPSPSPSPTPSPPAGTPVPLLTDTPVPPAETAATPSMA